MAQIHARLLAGLTVVYSQPKTSSPILAELKAGDEIKVGKAFDVDGESWRAADLSDGTTGYVASVISLFKMRGALLHQDAVPLFDAPDADSKPKALLTRGELVVVGDTDGAWTKIGTASGDAGFIRGDTRVVDETKSYLAFGCLALVVLAVAYLAIGLVLDHIADQNNDSLSHGGGRSRAYEWLDQGGILAQTDRSGALTDRCADRTWHGTSPVAVWAFGDDTSDFSKANYESSHVGNGILSWDGELTWAQVDAVLVVKLSSAGTETRTVSVPSQNNPLPDTAPTTAQEITVYNAEAWLIDKKTWRCLAHQSFKPGDDPDPDRTSMINPLVTLTSVDALRFRAVRHAIDWAKSPDN